MQRFLAVGEGAHGDDPAGAHGVNVGESDFLPIVAAFRADPRMHKHDDPVAGVNELFRLADDLGPRRTRLRQVLLGAITAVV